MIFIDMDGTVAKMFQKENYLEKMYEKDFFARLKPYGWVKDLNKLAEIRDDIYILSACVNTEYCEKEKAYWLRTHLPNIPVSHYIFTKVGENKAEKVDEMFGEKAGYKILIDDYSQNLYDWEMQDQNYIGIKYLNEINNKSKKHYKYTIKNLGDLNQILTKLGEVARVER
jgi:5'(3')-deoxyribonucleotidase